MRKAMNEAKWALVAKRALPATKALTPKMAVDLEAVLALEPKMALDLEAVLAMEATEVSFLWGAAGASQGFFGTIACNIPCYTLCCSSSWWVHVTRYVAPDYYNKDLSGILWNSRDFSGIVRICQEL